MQPYVDLKVYKSKFTYFKQTVESFANYLGPIKEAIYDLLLPLLWPSGTTSWWTVRSCIININTRGLGQTWLKSWSPAIIRCFNNSNDGSCGARKHEKLFPWQRAKEDLNRHRQWFQSEFVKAKVEGIERMHLYRHNHDCVVFALSPCSVFCIFDITSI